MAFSFKPLRPGVALMRRLRLPVKLGALALVLLLPLVSVSVLLSKRLSDSIAFTSAELDGSRMVVRLSATLEELQRHRGQTHLLLSGHVAAQDGLVGTRQKLQEQLGATEALLAERPDFDLTASWKEWRSRLASLDATQSMSAAEAYAWHSDRIHELNRFIYTVAERSNLLFDPEPASYFLMDMAVTQMPRWSELVAQSRGLGAGELAGAAPDALLTQRVLNLLGEARVATTDVLHQQGFIEKHGISDLSGQRAAEDVTGFLDGALAAMQAATRPSPAAYFETGTRAMTSLGDYQRAVQQALTDLLQARLAQERTALTWSLAAVCGGLVAVLYLMLSFYYSFVIDFRHAIEVMRETATGNLRAHIQVRGRDELAELAHLLEQMNAALSGMVAEVRSNSALVAYAGKSLAAGNRDLADRTEQQAANLEQTAASVQDLSQTVGQNAQTAGDADAQAGKVRDIAESGARTMNVAVSSVEGIQKSAQQMNEIIGVIDSLAFQTNILALNAAVEAARAGEQGRGFAVVAAEVRSLAQRSAASAREIRSLIEASGTQVEVGVRQIRAAGHNIEQIVEGVRAMASSMSLISSASSDQSAGLSDITAAVSQLDEITQRNAQMVERAVAQSNQLEHRAAHLSQAVSSFQLQQGTAEEAMELVRRAVENASRAGGSGYAQWLTDPANGFHDRDMYVFALDRSGAYRAFGGKPEKVGTRVQDIPGVDGQSLLEAIVSQAEREPGWVEYDIVNPLTGAVQTKMSFVTQVGELFVGCGVYKNAVMHVA